MTDFYLNLSVLINQRGLSRNKFLKDLGLGKSSMSNWETRNNIPNGDTLLKLSEYFQISIDELLGNKEYVYTKEEQKLIYQYRKALYYMECEYKKTKCFCWTSVLDRIHW